MIWIACARLCVVGAVTWRSGCERIYLAGLLLFTYYDYSIRFYTLLVLGVKPAAARSRTSNALAGTRPRAGPDPDPPIPVRPRAPRRCAPRVREVRGLSSSTRGRLATPASRHHSTRPEADTGSGQAPRRPTGPPSDLESRDTHGTSASRPPLTTLSPRLGPDIGTASASIGSQPTCPLEPTARAPHAPPCSACLAPAT